MGEKPTSFQINFYERVYKAADSDLTDYRAGLEELRKQNGPEYEKMCGELLAGVGKGIDVIRILGGSLEEETKYRSGVKKMLAEIPGIEFKDRQQENIRDERGILGLSDVGSDIVDTNRSKMKFSKDELLEIANGWIPSANAWAEVKSGE